MSTTRWLLVALLMGAGCSTTDSQQYGQCEAPDDHLKVLFKPTGSSPFSHSFCVVCNTGIEPEEYGDWATEMGATSIPDQPELPCLYVYPGTPTNIGSLAQCQSLVCDGNATYSDMVSKTNGNIDVTPMFSAASFELGESWIQLAEDQALSASASPRGRGTVPNPALQP